MTVSNWQVMIRSGLMWEPFCCRRHRLFQPSIGVKPTMNDTVQHSTTASPALRGVTTRLYLQRQKPHITSQQYGHVCSVLFSIQTHRGSSLEIPEHVTHTASGGPSPYRLQVHIHFWTMHAFVFHLSLTCSWLHRGVLTVFRATSVPVLIYYYSNKGNWVMNIDTSSSLMWNFIYVLQKCWRDRNKNGNIIKSGVQKESTSGLEGIWTNCVVVVD